IVLVGGSTRMRRVRQRLAEHFPGKKLRVDIEPDLAVAQGAAIMAASLAGGGERMSEGQASSGSSSSSSSGQGASGGSNGGALTLIDVTPLSIGLKLEGDEFCVMIPKNMPIPFESHELYTNAVQNDTNLRLEIVEGEEKVASKNHKLGEFDIPIPPRPKGKNKIEVIFNINKSGILEVNAIDQETRKQASITVQSENLRQGERDKMAAELARLRVRN
ncbi:hypothetical protein PFISCL1PPCAC_18638, partial [Pristionchus fissidentatus]